MDAENFKFRTEVSIEKPSFEVSLKSRVFLGGSCFADVIGNKLTSYKFNSLSNPFGNIYNPYSLFYLLTNSLKNTLPPDYTYIQSNGGWFNYNYHSEISGQSREELLGLIQSLSQKVGAFLKSTDILILTLGTAYVYRLIGNNDIVANCHKIRAKNFKKYLLSPKEIIDEFEKFREEVLNVNPNCKIIFTVSPVRHIKDTLPLNNLSKSILRTAIHYISETYSETSYFPSYEIMMDDLRDYRFYKEDMIHPTEQAENYIWEKFLKAYFDRETQGFIKDCENVFKAINHRPFRPDAIEHKKFLKDTLTKLEILNKKADFTKEINELNQRILLSF